MKTVQIDNLTSNSIIICSFYFLGERVYDITFWKSELNAEINAMENETDNLKVITKCEGK